MTEAQYQSARKVMQTANVLRGQITESKGVVARWTAIEDAHRKNGNIRQADAARKTLDKALKILENNRQRFADLKFPDETIVVKTKWIAALDCDSFNYEPKEIPEEKFLEANSEGFTLWDTKAAAQRECSLLNAQ